MGEIDVMVNVDEDIPCPLCVEKKHAWARMIKSFLRTCPVCKGTKKYHVHIDEYESIAEIERDDYYAPDSGVKNAIDYLCDKEVPIGMVGDSFVVRQKSHLLLAPRKKPAKSMKYSNNDFIVETNTGDSRIPYVIKTKDEKIEANVFWIEGEYNEIRGLIFDTKSGDIVKTFRIACLDKAHGKPDPAERFVRAVKLALERGQYE